MKQRLEINVEAAKWALQNKTHIEYFIACYLRANLERSGKYTINFLKNECICFDSCSRHLANNIFFTYNEKSKNIFLHSAKKLHFKTKAIYYVDLEEITPLASKLAHGSYNIIKKWNSTTIKYFFISIIASQYENSKPYALSLVKEDTGMSISTIQRALKVFDVGRTNKTQTKESLRSYKTKSGRVNLSPNYYFMPVGKFSKLT